MIECAPILICVAGLEAEPDDGAQHYVIIHGFHNPNLLSQLAEVGVTVDAIIRITAQDYTALEEVQSDREEKSDREKDEKTLGTNLKHNAIFHSIIIYAYTYLALVHGLSMTALRSLAQNVRQNRSLENVGGVTAIEFARQATVRSPELA